MHASISVTPIHDKGEFRGNCLNGSSADPRSCIGQNYAMLELKTTLGKVLPYYEIELADDSVKEPEMIGR